MATMASGKKPSYTASSWRAEWRAQAVPKLHLPALAVLSDVTAEKLSVNMLSTPPHEHDLAYLHVPLWQEKNNNM